MKHSASAVAALALLAALSAAQPPEKPVPKIAPGQVVIPLERMQRPWGELIGLDLKTRTGKFRREGNDEVVEFTVLPYAELLHHAALGDLQDFRVGERAIFRLHENAEGKWVWLTYIQDEMNMMNGHGEFFHVDGIDAEKRRLVCTQGKADKSYIREKNIAIETDGETRYWKARLPAKFEDIRVGAKLRTKTHGVGKGKVRVAWEVFLDGESLAKFQSEQKAVHSGRILIEGAPGYIDESKEKGLSLTLFAEGEEQYKRLKPGMQVQVAPAGVDRKPSGERVPAVVQSAKVAGKMCQVKLELSSPGPQFVPKNLARLWVEEK